jgi:hypothetical protein
MMEDNKQQKSFRKQKTGKSQKKPDQGKSLKEMRRELDALHKQFKNQLTSPKEAMAMYRTNNQYRAGIDTAIQGKARGKLAYLERLVGEKFLGSEFEWYHNPDTSTREKIETCANVYADDLASVLGSVFGGGSPSQIVGRLAMEFGPKVLDWLYSKAKAKVQSVFSRGSGTGLLTFPNSEMSLISPMKDMNSVNLEHLACLVCPEVYMGPLPDQFGPQVSTTQTITALEVRTDPSGNTIFYVVPDGVFQGTTLGVTSFFSVTQTPVTGSVNTTTGAITSPVYSGGPFLGSIGNFSSFRLTSCAFRFVPNLSATNNSGSALLAYTPNTTETQLGSTIPAIPQQTLLQYPWLHIAGINGTSEMRQLHIPHSVNDTTLDPAASVLASLPGLDIMNFQVIGCPVNTIVGRIYIASVIDWVPSDSGVIINKPKPTPEGPATLAAFAALIKRYPHVAQLTLDEAKELAERVISCPSDSYSTVLSQVMGHAMKYKSRPREMKAMSSGGQPGEVGEISFEKLLSS